MDSNLVDQCLTAAQIETVYAIAAQERGFSREVVDGFCQWWEHCAVADLRQYQLRLFVENLCNTPRTVPRGQGRPGRPRATEKKRQGSIYLPDTLWDAIDARTPDGDRNRWIREAVQQRLDREAGT